MPSIFAAFPIRLSVPTRFRGDIDVKLDKATVATLSLWQRLNDKNNAVDVLHVNTINAPRYIYGIPPTLFLKSLTILNIHC
jgi:hypothetical protein